MYFKKIIFTFTLVIASASSLLHAQSCGSEGAQVVDIYIPESYLDGHGSIAYHFESKAGSRQRRVFTKFKNADELPHVFYNVATLDGLYWENKYRGSGASCGDDDLLTEYEDLFSGVRTATPDENGWKIEKKVDGMTEGEATFWRLPPYPDGSYYGLAEEMLTIDETYYDVERWRYDCFYSVPSRWKYNVNLRVQLSEELSYHDFTFSETPVIGHYRIAYENPTNYRVVDFDLGVINFDGRTSRYSKYRWSPPSCGEWEFTPIFWRWQIGEEYSTGRSVSGAELDLEPDEDGNYTIEGEVEVLQGYNTKFIKIEARKNCSSMPYGSANGGAGSAYFNWGLGDLKYFKKAGSLGFYVTSIDRESFSANALRYANRDGVTEIFHPVDGSIRQIVLPEGLIDIVTQVNPMASAYNESVEYTVGDEVVFENYVFVSLQDLNAGNNPVLASNSWERKNLPLSVGNYMAGDRVWYKNMLLEANGSISVLEIGEELNFDITEWTIIHSPAGYDVCFYRPEDYLSEPDVETGIHQLNSNASPFVLYTVYNPEPSASSPDQLKIEEIRNGSVVNAWHWAQTGSNWSFSKGDGLIFTELTRVGAFDENTAVGATRTERRKLKNANNEVASDILKTYEMFDWGEELVSEARDPDGVNRVTQYHYHDEDNASDNYARLKLEIGPFGGWSYYTYDSADRTHKIISQHKNYSAPGSSTLPSGMTVYENANRVVEYLYDTDADSGWNTALGELKQTVTKLQGSEVSRNYRIKYAAQEKGRVLGFDTDLKKTSYRECTTVGAAWNSGNYLETIYLEVDEFELKGKPYSTKYPDGSVVRYTYEYESVGSQSLKTTIENGVYAYTPLQEFQPLGNKSIEVVDELGNLQWREMYFVNDLGMETLTGSEVATAWDPNSGKPTEIQYLDGTTRVVEYACCGVESEYSRDGMYTHYTYDSAGRVTDVLRGNALTSYVLDAAGRQVQTTITSNGERLETMAVYNEAGELVMTTDALDRITDYSYDTESLSSETYIRRRTSFPYTDGETPIWATVELNYQDGSPYRLFGPATVAKEFDHGGVSGGVYHEEMLLRDVYSQSGEFTFTLYDMLGRAKYVSVPPMDPMDVSDETEYSYDMLGRLDWVEDPAGIRTYYVYDDYGQVEKTYIGDDTFGPVQTNEVLYLPASWDGGVMAKVTYSLVGDNVLEEVKLEESLAPVTSGNEQKSVRTQFGMTTTTTTTYQSATPAAESVPYVAASKTVTTVVTDQLNNQVAKTINIYEDGLLVSVTSYDTLDSILTQTTYDYDAFGRLYTQTNANGTTTYDYYADGQLKSMTTPPAVDGSGVAGDQPQVTSYEYDRSPNGELTKITTLPDQKQLVEVYYPNGALKSRTGARTYPVEYEYDYAGRVSTMKTWQDFASGAPTLTHWRYNHRGVLEEKYYNYDPANPGSPDLSYTYDEAGRLHTRTGGRGIVTTYTTDPNYGYQTGITYDDGVTPSVIYRQFDRAGRYEEIEDAAGTRLLAYEYGQLMGEVYGPGPMNAIGIIRRFDDATRYSGYTLSGWANDLSDVYYDFDPVSSQLSTVSFSIVGGSTHTATYGYKPGTNRVDSVVQDNGSATILAVSKTYDNLNRLRKLQYDNAHKDFGMSFSYNSANQLTRKLHLDGSGANWVYEYDDLGQVAGARKLLPGEGVIPGYEFGYGYDDIGNRTYADRDGSADREQRYYSETNEGGINGANALNQYGSRSVPRTIGVMGSADPGASVSVNSQSVDRTGNYYQALLDYSGNNDAQIIPLDIEAILAGAGAGGSDAIAELSEQALLPPSPENYTYDADGNLKTDWRWIYTWNGENRLVALEPSAAAISLGLPNEKIAYAYDSIGRRFLREVYGWDSQTSDWETTPTEYTRYIYDGWNLIGEQTFESPPYPTPTDEKYYVWGLDLSESLQGAGGVGGLLAVVDEFDGTVAYPAYDHNGNVRAYVDADSAVTIAEYEYGPFGQLLKSSGVGSEDFSILFSTKMIDADSGYYYYGYRWYDDSIGRWLSRDPIRERGGFNLYVFNGNNSINAWDYLGLIFPFEDHYDVNDLLQANTYKPSSRKTLSTGWVSEKELYSAASSLSLVGVSLLPNVSKWIAGAFAVVDAACVREVKVSVDVIDKYEWYGTVQYGWFGHIDGFANVRVGDFIGTTPILKTDSIAGRIRLKGTTEWIDVFDDPWPSSIDKTFWVNESDIGGFPWPSYIP